jgi:multidrug resistance protein MdtO
MALAETAPLPAPRLPQLLGFLRRELAPTPGRAIGTVRIVIACVVTLVLCMALRVPEADLAVWFALRVVTEEAGQTLLFGIVALVAATIGLAMSLLLLTVAMDQAWLRFCFMAALAALGFFSRRTFVIGAFGFVVGLVGTLIMTLPDFVPDPELVVRATLWLWPVFALGIATSVAVNLLIAPSDPATLLGEALRARVQAAEDAVARQLGAPTPGSETTPALATLVTAGMARMLALLRSVEIVHPSLKRRHGQQSALITLADRLVTAAAAFELTAPMPLGPAARARLQRIADECGRVRRALAAGRVPEPAPPPSAAPYAGERAAALPTLVELEHVVNLLRKTLESDDVPAEAAALAEPRRLFVPDAFTNPEYRRYALKGSLAVMICYVLQSAVDWPGIHTCIVTCMIVGLTSEGATIQKATLRFSGALVGGLMGFLSILLLIPNMVSITSLVLVVAAGAAIAGWVDLGSPRISYAGAQIALAFFMCVIQGFAPEWHFDTLRDRLVGIALGNVVITLVFLYVWPVDALSALWRNLAAALRTTARLATVESETEDAAAMARSTAALRAQADRSFGAVQQSLEEAGFEPSVPGERDWDTRAALQRVTIDAQAVFLDQLAVARHRPDFALALLPPALRAGIRRLNTAVAARLDAVADRIEGKADTPLPDLQAPLADLAGIVESLPGRAATADLAAEARARLALYRGLVPRIEALSAASSAEHLHAGAGR